MVSNGAVSSLARDGLRQSGDCGLTWSRVAAAFPPDEIMDVALDGSNLFVLLPVAGSGRGRCDGLR